MKKVHKIALFCSLVVTLVFLAIHVTVNGVVYDPFGGIYIRVTDCDKPYIGGYGSFSGPSTRFNKSFVKVPQANWYSDRVETVAQSLWRIDEKLYDDSYLIFRENGIRRTHRFINAIDESSLHLMVDDYYGPVSFRDDYANYVFSNSDWRGNAKVDDFACPDTLMGIPTLSNTSSVDSSNRKALLGKALLSLIEIDEEFVSRGNTSIDGFGSAYVTINDRLYYKPNQYAQAVDLGFVGEDAIVQRLHPGRPTVSTIVTVNNEVYGGGQKLPGQADSFSLINTGFDERGRDQYSENFIALNNKIYFMKRPPGEPLEIIETEADYGSFILSADQSRSRNAGYEDNNNFYITNRNGYTVRPKVDFAPTSLSTSSVSEVQKAPFIISNVTTTEVLKLEDGDSQTNDGHFNVFWDYEPTDGVHPKNAAIFFSLVDEKGVQLTGASLRGAGDPGVYQREFVRLYMPPLCSSLQIATEGCIPDDRYNPDSEYRLVVNGVNCRNTNSNPGYCLEGDREPIKAVYSNWFTLKETLDLEDKGISYIEGGTITVNESTNTMTVSVAFGYRHTKVLETVFISRETVLEDALTALRKSGYNAQYVDENNIAVVFQ